MWDNSTPIPNCRLEMDHESSLRPATPKRPFAVRFGLKSMLVAVLLLTVPLAGVASYHQWRQAHKSYEQSLQSYNVGVIALEDVEQASEKLATIEGSRIWISNESAVRGHKTRMHEPCDGKASESMADGGHGRVEARVAERVARGRLPVKWQCTTGS